MILNSDQVSAIACALEDLDTIYTATEGVEFTGWIHVGGNALEVSFMTDDEDGSHHHYLTIGE